MDKKSNAGRKTNSNIKERKEKILKFLKSAGAWKISQAVVKELSKEFDVTDRQIYLDIKNVIKKIPRPKVNIVGNKFLISFEYAIDKAITMMRDPDGEKATSGIKLYFEAVDKFTRFMENYGYKEKVAEKFEHSGKIFNVNITEVQNEHCGSETGDEQTTEPGLDNPKG